MFEHSHEESHTPEFSQDSISEFDKLTLQMFSNKTHYKKYLAKTDPVKYSAQQEFIDKIAKNREKIKTMFLVLLDSPEKQITTDINESFDQFVKSCLNHFHMEKLSKMHDQDKDDFDATSDDDNDDDNSPDIASSTSYWGASVVKKNAIRNTLDGFVRKGSHKR
uniref:Uncharacterized protein n=1 Tax=viral metagenome TaxID=1070528 RepID=A0A6C0D5Z3_9ZZZZ